MAITDHGVSITENLTCYWLNQKHPFIWCSCQFQQNAFKSGYFSAQIQLHTLVSVNSLWNNLFHTPLGWHFCHLVKYLWKTNMESIPVNGIKWKQLHHTVISWIPGSRSLILTLLNSCHREATSVLTWQTNSFISTQITLSPLALLLETMYNGMKWCS